MISVLRCDEQEELADHIKSSDKHYERPHRRRDKILVVHYEHPLLCSVCEKTVYDKKNPVHVVHFK